MINQENNVYWLDDSSFKGASVHELILTHQLIDLQFQKLEREKKLKNDNEDR